MTSSTRPGLVFLGGACGTTTWRRDISIPLLEAAGISFHDPQLPLGEWTAEHQTQDMRAKADAEVLLFVITEQTRGVASVAEVAYLIASGRPLALCLRMLPASHPEADDLNRGRLFLEAMAGEHGLPVFEDEAAATRHAIELVRRRLGPMTPDRLRALLDDVSCGVLRFAVDGLRLRVEDGSGWTGRWWSVAPTDSESDVVRTAFKAAITWEEHELRERFRYKGVAVFGPHVDVDRLRQAV